MEMHRRRFLGIIGLSSLAVPWAIGEGERRSGPGLALQFDDGWRNWTEVIAPELERAGGKATGFVCNQYVDNERTTVKQLRKLQDDYGWEIGSHGYHHVHAPRYVTRHGLAKWLEDELGASLDALNKAGLTARSLAFPFNALTPALASAVTKRVESYRRAEPLAIAPGVRADGSVPGTTIDIARYTPVDIIRSWIDFAARKRQVLFLYGHRILPDEQFATGTIMRIEGQALSVREPVNVPDGEELILVPNPGRRASRRTVLRVARAKDREIRVDAADTERLKAGDKFILGPSYGTCLSDFRAILAHAKGKLPFYTLHEIAKKRHLEK